MSDDRGPDAKPETLSYFTPTVHPRLVTLRRVGPMEAQLAKLKLESEGIRCFVFDQEAVTANPLIFADVKLEVAEDDIERAEEILARPAASDAEGEYADEPYRCPKCHRKDQVELLPLRTWHRRACNGVLALLVAPLVLLLLKALFPDADFRRSIDTLIDNLRGPWVLLTVALGAYALLATRTRHCGACGHNWVKTEA
jgi:hypothetical protein